MVFIMTGTKYYLFRLYFKYLLTFIHIIWRWPLQSGLDLGKDFAQFLWLFVILISSLIFLYFKIIKLFLSGIPSHVHIDRLPAASGLHLLFSGLFYIFMGPIVGFIRDNSNFTVTLHCLNICTFTTATTWMIEKILLNRRKRNQKRREMEIDGNERE